nr:hypothetical protein [Tanacetum cinerariifolium]
MLIQQGEGSDEPASPVRDVSKGEACPTDSGFIADQDRATIAKSSTLPQDTAPRVTSPAAVEGTTVLVGGIDVPTGSCSILTVGPPVIDIHTGSDAVSTASLIVATASVVTPYSRRKGKEVMVESDTPKKQRDAEAARIHAEEELQDFIPMGSKEEFESLKRKGFNLEQEEVKKQKTSEEVKKQKTSEEWSASCDCQRQRDLHASREGLSSEEWSSLCDDLLQASG